MSKERKTKKISDITEVIQEIAGTDLGNQLGIFQIEENHIGIGTPLSDNQFTGEGLPNLENTENERNIDFSFTFDCRVISKDSGILELQIAKKGTGRYWKFEFSDLTAIDSINAAREFKKNIFRAKFIERMLYHLALASYRSQDKDEKRQASRTKIIIENISELFEEIITPKAFKFDRKYEESGLEIKEYSQITKTKKEFLKEKERFLESIYEAFQNWKNKHPKISPKQKDISLILFGIYGSHQKEMTIRLNNYELNFKKLYEFYEGRNMKEFVNLFI